MDREYLEDYDQKEKAEWKNLVKRIREGKFSFEKDRYPPDERFVNLQKPVATTTSLGLAGMSDIWAQIPFCGSLILYLPPVPKAEFEKVFCKITQIPKMIDFIKETGKLQVIFTGGDLLSYEGLDYLDPFFEELRPPRFLGIPSSTFGDEKERRRALNTFSTLGKVKYLKWLKKRYTDAGLPFRLFMSALEKKSEIYVFLKLGHYTVIEEIENLTIDDPEKAHWVLSICGVFIFDSAVDLRSDLRNFPLEAIRSVQDLPPIYRPEIRFPCEIGKLLVKKLTYAPLGFDACKELMYHYDACDLEEFKEYYKRNGFAGEQGTGELGVTEEGIITQDPSHLIVWREKNKIIGDAIWHETNTEEHRKGVPRDKEDIEILEKLLGGKKDFVELHEVWLMKEYRRRGYGKRFFDFFEEFMRNRGIDSIVFYADHPAALAICRKRGYKEDYLKSEGEYVFYIPLKKHTS
ncbi:MAG: GNAT family N-acetyltransferase [Candidatus Bathyarchaeota archaeon]|nr:GNAT family N-acetyltransferase [Candidatus Bathyarchaeota archaeon]